MNVQADGRDTIGMYSLIELNQVSNLSSIREYAMDVSIQPSTMAKRLGPLRLYVMNHRPWLTLNPIRGRARYGK